MNFKLWLTLALMLFVSQTGRANEEPSAFTAIGSFSNMRFTQEHQYGSEIQLWREGANLLGFFFHSDGGLTGDTPAGLIENVTYNPATGMISFVSKLTIGQHFCKVHQDIPSRDSFTFQGKLSNSSLSGVLKRADGLHPENPPMAEEVTLKRMGAENQPLYSTRASWDAASKQILKFRGPRW